MRYQACDAELAEAMSEPEMEVCSEELDCADSVPVANRSTDKKVNGAFDKADIGVLLWRTAGQRTAADWRKWHNERALPNPLASWNLLASM